MISEGGGRVTAARKSVRGKAKLAHALEMFGTKYGASLEHTLTTINGKRGLITFAEGKIFSVTTFEFTNGKISALYRVMNPDKLKAF